MPLLVLQMHPDKLKPFPFVATRAMRELVQAEPLPQGLTLIVGAIFFSTSLPPHRSDWHCMSVGRSISFVIVELSPHDNIGPGRFFALDQKLHPKRDVPCLIREKALEGININFPRFSLLWIFERTARLGKKSCSPYCLRNSLLKQETGTFKCRNYIIATWCRERTLSHNLIIGEKVGRQGAYCGNRRACYRQRLEAAAPHELPFRS